VRHLQGFRIFDTLVRDQEVLSFTFLFKCDKNCDKNPAVAAKVNAIGSSTGKGINKFRVFNIAPRIRLTGSSAILSFIVSWLTDFVVSIVTPV
jgi:hypothetical protein